MLLQTIELRWFLEGQAPSGVRDWLAATGLADALEPEVRVDDYLALPGVDDLGIKIREGRFEVKGRTSRLGVWHLGRRAVGEAEQWSKWSHDERAVGRLLGGLREACVDVVAVAKNRVQRRFDLNRPDQPVAVALDRLPLRGATVEVVDVEARGRRDWSVGIEAYPASPTVESALRRWGHELLGQAPRSLDRAHARSYPAWLADWVLG